MEAPPRPPDFFRAHRFFKKYRLFKKLFFLKNSGLRASGSEFRAYRV